MLKLVTDNTEINGKLFEISGGWVAQTRWQRAGGHSFPNAKPYTPEDVVEKWRSITNFGQLSVRCIFGFCEPVV